MLGFVIILLFFIFVFLASQYFFIGKDKYKHINLLMILFVFTFNPSLGFEQTLINETNPIRINTITIAIFVCLLFVINKSTFYVGKESFFFVPLALLFFCDFITRVDDYYKFFSITFTYLSVFLLYLIIKSIKLLPVIKILKFVNFLALINGLLSIVQYLTGLRLLIGTFTSSILYTEGAEEARRAIGLAGTNNSAGNFGAILFGVVLYNFLKDRTFFNAFVLIVSTIGTILTFTRIGYVSIIIQLIIFVIFTKAKKRNQSYFKIVFLSFSIPIILSIIYLASDEIINKLFTERGDTQSARFDQFIRAYDYIISKDFWFGVGTGQYKYYLYSKYGLYDIDLHSQYLNVLAENGFIMFILFVWFNIWLLVKSIKNNPERSIRILIISLYLGNFICVNFNPNAHYYLVNVLYFLLMFLLARGTRNEIIKEK